MSKWVYAYIIEFKHLYMPTRYRDYLIDSSIDVIILEPHNKNSPLHVVIDRWGVFAIKP